jgi:hypothetical protein
MALLMKPTIPIAFALIATFLVFSVTAQVDTSFCSNATVEALCTELTRGATTWPEAMSNAISGAIINTQAGKKIVDSIEPKLPVGLRPIIKKSVMEQCYMTQAGMMRYLKLSLVCVKEDPDADGLNYMLSGTRFDDCIDALGKFKVTLPEVTEYAQRTASVTNALLAIEASRKGHEGLCV